MSALLSVPTSAHLNLEIFHFVQIAAGNCNLNLDQDNIWKIWDLHVSCLIVHKSYVSSFCDPFSGI